MCEHGLSSAAAEKFAELDAFIDGLHLDPADPRRRGRLIQILHRAQHLFGYLPREVQQHVAQKMAIPESAVSGVVSFYNYFTTKPKGKYVVNVCLGTACYVKGSETVLREIERHLGVEADTTPTALTGRENIPASVWSPKCFRTTRRRFLHLEMSTPEG